MMLPVFGSKSNRGATGTAGRSVQDRPSLHRAEMFNVCVGLFKGKLWFWCCVIEADGPEPHQNANYVISLQYFGLFLK